MNAAHIMGPLAMSLGPLSREQFRHSLPQPANTKQPISRQFQIEMMVSAPKRLTQMVKRMMSCPSVYAALRKPPPTKSGPC